MTSLISQKEYLKKYLSGDVKKKKKKKITGANNIKRSVIVDDDIDLKSMRSLEDDEVELYQMDEDAPMIAGIVDERPPEVKAQEYYSSKRWKVFGGEDGVNVVDSMNKNQHDTGKALKASNNLDETDSPSEESNSHIKSKRDKKDSSRMLKKETLQKKETTSHDNDFYAPQKDKKLLKNNRKQSNSDESPPHLFAEKGKQSHYDDSDVSPPRKRNRNSNTDSDASSPRRKYDKGPRHSNESQLRRDSRKKSPKHSSRYGERERGKVRNRSHSNSPLRREKPKKHKSKSESDDSPPRREKNSYKRDKYDSDASPPRKKDKYKTYVKNSPSRMEKRSYKQEKSDSDASPPRRTGKYPDNNDRSRGRRGSPSYSDNSPPRKERRRSPKPQISRRRSSRSRTPPKKDKLHSSRKSYIDKPPRPSMSGTYERKDKSHVNDSDNSPQRRRGSSKGSDSDMSPPRNTQVNDRPLKKVLYKPNDNSSSDEGSKNKKMKTTLDGRHAGLQDAKQLKKELSDLKMKEDTMFSKMDASVSGLGAAPVKRDRKTGQIRDLEKEKEAQRQKEAKESVVNEKYYKWGKGIKQTEDAAIRAAEAVKEMNKPLARYVDDRDLDEFLKAQDREGDPMLEYIKRKQSESTPLQGENPIYKGSWNPNRFNIRPGYRWDGVVRSNGYEQEWFKTKNAKKARDEEAYKWSTSDM